MPWPIVTIVVKVFTVKFIKGAAFGLGRYSYKVVTNKPTDEHGRTLKGVARLKHNLHTTATEKENVLFLILMLSNVFFGAQEMTLWCWHHYAKRRHRHFRTGMPSALIDPETLCTELKNKTWREILPHLGRWVAIASLVYWPAPQPPLLRTTLSKDARWLEVAYKRHIYMIRIDAMRQFNYAGMDIHINDEGHVTITSECKQHTAHHKPDAIE